MCLTFSAPAAAPLAVISGPDRANQGDLVVLDATASQNALGFAWVLVDSDKSFLPVDDGKRVVFATGTSGRFTFVLVAAGADGQGKPLVSLARHAVVVGDAPTPGPNPPPGPGPPTPPGPQPGPPPLPPGRFNLATQSRDWASLVQLDAAARKSSASALAGSFDAMAAKIAAGPIKTIQEAIDQTRQSNQAALGAYAPAWMPWAARWNQAMAALHESGQVKTLADCADAWRETAIGLRAVS
jgi:hypothetical protein